VSTVYRQSRYLEDGGNVGLNCGPHCIGYVERGETGGPPGAVCCDHHHDLLCPCGPDSNRSSLGYCGHSFCRVLHANRGDHSVGGEDDVNHPTLDPEPPVGVEVADVAGAVPAVRL
jgi:hypothetical protein